VIKFRERFRILFIVFLLSLLGSLPVAAFYISALFPGYSPLFLGDAGTILILIPIVVGILFGAILGELDLRVIAAGTIVITITASVLITVFIVSPILAGVAQAITATLPNEMIEVFVAQRVMLFVVISFPMLLLGAVVGGVLAERMLPSEQLRQEIEKLRRDTKEWHELLERVGKVREMQEQLRLKSENKDKS